MWEVRDSSSCAVLLTLKNHVDYLDDTVRLNAMMIQRGLIMPRSMS